jgi:predicted thioesterase
MKNTLAAGINATREFVVDRERTIDFMGDEARVYATPMLVRDIEVTCRELLLAHLDPGEDSVGTRIELDHLAPSLLGAKVVLSVRATEVKGRAVTFELGGAEGHEAICRGRHTRFVVELAQTRERLRRKQAKAA